MESLALAAALIVLGVFTLGVPSVLFAFRPPRSRPGRVFVFLLSPLSFAAGSFLFAVVVTSFRLFGLVFAVSAAVAFFRALRSGRSLSERPGGS